MIPPGFIQELLARTDIVDVVGRHVQLKKAGINHKGLCPFHGEKSPSFIVSPSRQTYHCFGCGAHGNAVGFLMEHGGLSYVDAIQELAQSVALEVPREEGPRDGARRGNHISLTHPEGYRIMQALIARGVIGDFRAPDVLRFGFGPLYLRFVDIWDTVATLEDIAASGAWQAIPAQPAGTVT